MKHPNYMYIRLITPLQPDKPTVLASEEELEDRFRRMEENTDDVSFLGVVQQ